MTKLTHFHNQTGFQDKFVGVRPGWTIKVFQKIKEGDKSRVQAFEGMVIARKHGSEPGGTIIVRKVTDGIGVEKTFPVYLPSIDKVQVVRRTTARRAKLFYIREKSSREIKRKVKSEKANTVSEKPAESQEESA